MSELSFRLHCDNGDAYRKNFQFVGNFCSQIKFYFVCVIPTGTAGTFPSETEDYVTCLPSQVGGNPFHMGDKTSFENHIRNQHSVKPHLKGAT